MKKVFTCLMILMTFVACKKDKNLKPLYGKFAGVWEYENYSGYPFTNNFLPAGNGRIIKLSMDGSFERRAHDTVLYKGKYSISEKADCLKRENTIFYSTNENYGTEGYIDLENGRLTISSSNCLADGGTVYYRKVE